MQYLLQKREKFHIFDKELKRRYPFSMHINGKDKKGAFIQPMVGKDKNGKPIWGDKIYLKK